MSMFKHKSYLKPINVILKSNVYFLKHLVYYYDYPETNSLKAGNPVNFCIIFMYTAAVFAV